MRKLRKFGLLAGAMATLFVVSLLVPSAVAQAGVTFGSQVKLGDSDFKPSLTDAGSPSICRIDFGTAGTFTDDGFYVVWGTAGTTATYSMRLVQFGSGAPGTLLSDADSTENPKACVAEGSDTSPSFQYADVNNDNRYDEGDYVYVCAGATIATGDLSAPVTTTSPDSWCIRLTAAGAKAAGTLVLAGESDLTSYDTTSLVLTGAEFTFFDKDLSAPAALITPGDSIWLASQAVVTNDLVPLYSIQLAGGTFGTQVMLGNADFTPLVTQDSSVSLCRVDFGTAGTFTDDGYYLMWAGTAVTTYAMRLTAFGANAAGTLVTDTDSTEWGKACADGADTTPSFVYADLNSDTRYDEGDYVYACSGGTPTANDLAAPSSTPTPDVWCIRLTAAGGKVAGTLVLSGDSDLTSYDANSPLLDPDGDTTIAQFGFFDKDLSGTVTPGDSIWLGSDDFAAATNNRVGLYSVRVAGGTFGAQVKLGDSDFIASLRNIATTSLCRVDYGTAGTFTDDGYYAVFGTGDVVATYSMRLSTFASGQPGSLVLDTDSSENGRACSDGTSTDETPSFQYADVNSNNRYDEGDYAYACTNAGTTPAVGELSAPSAATVDIWCIRLTAAGAKAAGTLVLAADADLTSYDTTSLVLTGAEFTLFDKDLSGAVTPGDSFWVASKAVATGDLVSLYSVRLSGPQIVVAPPPTTTPPATSPPATTPPATSPPATTPPATSPPATTPPATSPPATTTSPSPGFELVVLVGAAAAAAVVLRRKR